MRRTRGNDEEVCEGGSALLFAGGGVGGVECATGTVSARARAEVSQRDVGPRRRSSLSFVVRRSSFVVRRSSFVVCRSSFVVRCVDSEFDQSIEFKGLCSKGMEWSGVEWSTSGQRVVNEWSTIG